MSDTKYKFVGPGIGVTGLPHEVSAEQEAQWEKEYKAADLKRKAVLGKIKDVALREAQERIDASQLARMPWGILKVALKRRIYEEVKASSGKEGGKK